MLVIMYNVLAVETRRDLSTSCMVGILLFEWHRAFQTTHLNNYSSYVNICSKHCNDVKILITRSQQTYSSVYMVYVCAMYTV